jgi:salicylate hydroxylase
MKVIIIGSGIGGLACAIACAQEGLEVTILERAPELLPVRQSRTYITNMKVLY